MPLHAVRNNLEYPSPSEVAGEVVYDANIGSLVVVQAGVTNHGVGSGNLQTLAAAGTVLNDSGVVLLTTTGTYAATLPSAAIGKGKMIWLLKTAGTGTITITSAGAETINGSATKAITTQWTSVLLVSDGTNWNALHNAVVA